MIQDFGVLYPGLAQRHAPAFPIWGRSVQFGWRAYPMAQLVETIHAMISGLAVSLSWIAHPTPTIFASRSAKSSDVQIGGI